MSSYKLAFSDRALEGYYSKLEERVTVELADLYHYILVKRKEKGTGVVCQSVAPVFFLGGRPCGCKVAASPRSVAVLDIHAASP